MVSMVTAKQILHHPQEAVGETPGKFAKRFGVRTTIINWENENRGPPKTSYAQHYITERRWRARIRSTPRRQRDGK